MRFTLLLILFLSSLQLFAQDEEKKVLLNGYLKDMAIVDFSPEDSAFFTNLVHNRLNFKWYPSSEWSAYVELRTRWYAGDYVGVIPNFEGQLDDTEDFFDLSWVVASNDNNVLHTMVDRAFVEYAPEGWNFRLGRQRINWGVSLAWNPNDVFNAYSYVDFDYEERPGSDAFRIQHFLGFASSIEFATNVADSLGSWVSAVKYATNKNNYDVQAIAGIAKKDITLGGAWAGNIKGAGFKGETTLFIPISDNPQPTALVGTISMDYNFKSSLYLNLSYLYNSNGVTDAGAGGFVDFYFGQLTARNLSPYRHSFLFLSTYQFHPLIFGSLSVMPFPGNKAMFLSPGLTVSVLSNFDLDLIGQLFYGEFQGDFQSLSNVLFVRAKWSF